MVHRHYEPPLRRPPLHHIAETPASASHHAVCTRRYILHPVSSGRVMWDYALRLLVLGTLVVVPLRLAFLYEDPPRTHSLAAILYADTALDVLCVLDFMSNFSFGFVTVNPNTARREVVSDWRRM